MKKLFNKISLGFMCVLIIYLPFADLISNLLEWRTNLNQNSIFWLTHWYIFVVLFLFVWAIVSVVLKKLKLSQSQIITFLLLGFGALSIFFISPTVSQGIEGFRFTFFALIFYLFAREVDLSQKWFKSVINIYLLAVTLVVFWALLERFFPLRYWSVWGAINPEIVFGYGWHTTGSLMQSASFLGGPNQLASYLLPAVFISANRIQTTSLRQGYEGQADNSRSRIATYCILLTVLCLAILLTSSRSAIVGLIVGLIILAWAQKGKILQASILSGLGVLAIFSFWLLSVHPQFKDIFTHGVSQTGHIESLKITLHEIKNRFHEPVKLIFGAGIGTAGPIALKYKGVIPESWFLQILLELGIVGLSLYLTLFYFIGQELWRKKEKSLFFGFIAVLVTALFLHTLSDNPALTYTLFILIGLNSFKENDGQSIN